MKCNICPRECNADRNVKRGFCGMPEGFVVARASRHFWEEPPISGTRGSGTIFFSGCSLGCIFCQNYEISHGHKGKEISDERLKEIFDDLRSQGAHNINLVNPTHYAIRLKSVLREYRREIPVVYNSSGYEKVSTLRELEGLVDVYLPDFKYITGERAMRYSAAENYADYVTGALLEMKRQCPENIYDSEGLLKRGMLVRHLILPKNTNRSLEILSWIKNNLGEDTVISLMSQYTPYGRFQNAPELQRKITKREYEKVITAAENMGFRNLFLQESDSASEKFIPKFDFTGI